MNTEPFIPTRLAGLLLLLSVALLSIAVTLIASQGKLGGMAAAFRGVGLQSADASGLRTIGRFSILSVIAQIAGFALFTERLREAGDRGLAIAGLALVVFALAIAAVEGSFHANVTVWAASEAARKGAAPEFFEPLRRWANGDIQLTYVSAFLTAMLLFSWSALRTGLLAGWLGWAALGWNLLSFPLYFLVIGAPAVIFVSPLLFGIGLLLLR